MHLTAELKVLNDDELDLIIADALNILQETGLVVENQPIIKKLESFGGNADYAGNCIKFNTVFVRGFLESSKKNRRQDNKIRLKSVAEIFSGKYLDPHDDNYKEWNFERFTDYIRTMQALDNVDGAWMLGCPLAEVPLQLQPLYEKLYCWKYGITGGKSIWDTSMCGPIYDMWHIYAEETGKSAAELYNGTVYLISPLKFAKEEAEQFYWFYEHGLRTTAGTLASLGGSAPVSIAGALALHTAENIFLNILNRAFFGSEDLHFYSYMSVMDMKTASFRYGRPEQALFNIACSQLAASLGASVEPHCGQSDSFVPGFEAGVQKLTSAFTGAMACGEGYICAGLLGVDEVFSPVQMILDNEIAGMMKRIFEGVSSDDEARAADAIRQTGPGGLFLNTEHTAANYREQLWLPQLWSDQMFSGWRGAGSKTEIDKARSRYDEIRHNTKAPESRISELTEKRLLDIINRYVSAR